jgi:hypothetical protein
MRERPGIPRRLFLASAITASMVPLLEATARAQGVHVMTYQNDKGRTGQNLRETTLNRENVNLDKFGKLFTIPVDGDLYAQPLYLSGVTIKGGGHDVVYVATQHDSVYAFDAHTPGPPLWKTSFLTSKGVASVPTPQMANNATNVVGSFDIVPEVGITGTPVIDADPANPTAGTLYVVAKTQETDDKGAVTYHQRLHALDVATGQERVKPREIEATIPGTGRGFDLFDPENTTSLGDNDGKGHVVFSPLKHLQRPGLLLSKGVVYVGFASHGDQLPYHGWMFAFKAGTLEPIDVFCTTPNGGRAGVWQSGGAPAADDAGNVYFATGNGTFDANQDWGDSVVKLVLQGDKLVVTDSFTPYDQSFLSEGPNGHNDFDLGSTGPMLLPRQGGPFPNLLVTSGKEGVIYLINRDNMGKYDGISDHIVQRLPASPNDQPAIGVKYGMPGYFNGSIYYVGGPLWKKQKLVPFQVDPGYIFPLPSDPFKQFKIADGKVDPTPASQSKALFAMKTSTPSISAPGPTGSGIVWYLKAEGMSFPLGPATLYAFDSSDLSKELYNSDLCGSCDQPGQAMKFAVPTVANGKVYVGSKGGLVVYGLRK